MRQRDLIAWSRRWVYNNITRSQVSISFFVSRSNKEIKLKYSHIFSKSEQRTHQLKIYSIQSHVFLFGKGKLLSGFFFHIFFGGQRRFFFVKSLGPMQQQIIFCVSCGVCYTWKSEIVFKTDAEILLFSRGMGVFEPRILAESEGC